MYSEFTYNASIWLIYPLGAFFIFVLVLGDREYQWQAGVLVAYAAISISMPDLDSSMLGYKRDWINQCFISLMISGAASTAMLLTSVFGKLSKRQSTILLFAVVYNSMVVFGKIKIIVRVLGVCNSETMNFTRCCAFVVICAFQFPTQANLILFQFP